MSGSFKWTELTEKLLDSIVSTNHEKGRKKWTDIVKEFNTATQSSVSSQVLTNKWNSMKTKKGDAKKAVGLLKNSSGMGTSLKTVDPEVLAEFAAAHPGILNAQLDKIEIPEEHYEAKESKVKVDYFCSPKRESDNKKPRLSEFESQMISILTADNSNDKVETPMDAFQKALVLLNEMSFSDEDYFKAIDVLHENGNALKFISIPEMKRIPFLLNKLQRM